MYEKYRTEAIVLAREPRGEGDACMTLLTREFGVITVDVKSVREERSHLRYALQTLTFLDATLVRGKISWRVAGARALEIYGFSLQETASRTAAFRIAFLIRRLVRGDFPEAVRFFETYRDALAAFLLHEKDTVSVRSIETLCVLRMLAMLGYVAPKPSSLSLFLEQNTFTDTHLTEAEAHYPELVGIINASLSASQM